MGVAAISDAISALRAGGRVLMADGLAKGEVATDGIIVAAKHDRPWFAARTLGFQRSSALLDGTPILVFNHISFCERPVVIFRDLNVG